MATSKSTITSPGAHFPVVCACPSLKHRELITEWCLSNLKALYEIGSYYDPQDNLVLTRKQDQREILRVEPTSCGIHVVSSLEPLDIDCVYPVAVLGQFHVTMLVAELQRHRDVLQITR